MSGISNGESALSVRGKLNAALTREPQNVAALVANTTLTYSTGQPGTVAAGDIITTRAEGFRYQVVGASADHDLATAGGVRLLVLPDTTGTYNFAAMAPAANGTTDDYPKLKRLLDKVIPGSPRGPTIYLPTAIYFMGQTIELKKPVTIKGDADGYFTDFTAQLRFPQNTHGIVVNRFNTLSTGLEIPPTTGADNSVISGILVSSLGGTDRTKHGIWLRARAKLHAVSVKAFPGNGCHIFASFDGDEFTLGNANNWYLEFCNFQGNRNHGLYVDGADANAGIAVACDFVANGRSGCFDSSFLGNTYIACHAATNGLRNKGGNASDQSCVVSHLGQRYAARWSASAAQLVETEPGTNSNVWVPYQAGGESDNYPLWAAGKPQGTYFPAFGYFSDGLVASNAYFNCYSEVDAPSALLFNATQYGILMEGLITNSAISGREGSIQANGANFSRDSQTLNLLDGTGWAVFQNSSLPNPWRLQPSGDAILMRNGNQSSRTAFFVTGPTATTPWGFGVEQMLWGTSQNHNREIIANAPPTTGTWLRGDRVRVAQATPGGWSGWICVTAGTPGVWKGFGAIEP